MKHAGIKLFAFTSLFASFVLFANAATVENLCEQMHTEYLLKARKALAENRQEDALRLLIEAQAIAKKCAESTDRPLQQQQLRDSGHAARVQPSFS